MPASTPPRADQAAAALQRDCERSRWGQHFACDCMREAFASARTANPREPDFKLQERIAPGCLSEAKIRTNVRAECLRNPVMVKPQDPEASCSCEAAETYRILRSEPGLVFDSAGNQRLLELRGRACSPGGNR